MNMHTLYMQVCIEYDMDIEDDEWLASFNAKVRCGPVLCLLLCAVKCAPGVCCCGRKSVIKRMPRTLR